MFVLQLWPDTGMVIPYFGEVPEEEGV